MSKILKLFILESINKRNMVIYLYIYASFSNSIIIQMIFLKNYL